MKHCIDQYHSKAWADVPIYIVKKWAVKTSYHSYGIQWWVTTSKLWKFKPWQESQKVFKENWACYFMVKDYLGHKTSAISTNDRLRLSLCCFLVSLGDAPLVEDEGDAGSTRLVLFGDTLEATEIESESIACFMAFISETFASLTSWAAMSNCSAWESVSTECSEVSDWLSEYPELLPVVSLLEVARSFMVDFWIISAQRPNFFKQLSSWPGIFRLKRICYTHLCQTCLMFVKYKVVDFFWKGSCMILSGFNG